MPRIATNYETTEVSFYRFVCNDPEIKSSYVGHTVNFKERKHNHKSICNNSNPLGKGYNYKIYQTIRDNGGWDNWRMIEIEKRFVKDKREAERIETDLMKTQEADMNSYKAFCGFKTREEYTKQYRIENADKIKNYREINQKKRASYQLEKITCECGALVCRASYSKHKKSPKHAELMELKIASII